MVIPPDGGIKEVSKEKTKENLIKTIGLG